MYAVVQNFDSWLITHLPRSVFSLSSLVVGVKLAPVNDSLSTCGQLIFIPGCTFCLISGNEMKLIMLSISRIMAF